MRRAPAGWWALTCSQLPTTKDVARQSGARRGVPIVTGPGMENFVGISELLIAAGAMRRLGSAASLGSCLLQLLGDPRQRQRMGAAGVRVVADNRGAVARQLALVAEQLAAG